MFIERFSSMLWVARKKTKKTGKKMAVEIGVYRQCITKWEQQELLPDPSRIKCIAMHYRIDDDILMRALQLALKERDSLNEARRSAKKKGKPQKIGTFSGEIGKAHMRHYLNLGLNVWEDNL